MKFFSTIILFIIFSLDINANDSMILDDLTTPGITTQKQNWAFFTDGGMGGLSQGKAIISIWPNPGVMLKPTDSTCSSQ